MSVAVAGMDVDLDRRRRAVIAWASMVAEASAAPLDGHTSHGKPGGHAPQIAGRSTLDEFLAMFDAAGEDDAAVRSAVERAESERHRITHGPARTPETHEQLAWRICNLYLGRPTAFVARQEHSTDTVVRKIRESAGQDSRGRPREGEQPDRALRPKTSRPG